MSLEHEDRVVVGPCDRSYDPQMLEVCVGTPDTRHERRVLQEST